MSLKAVTNILTLTLIAPVTQNTATYKHTSIDTVAEPVTEGLLHERLWAMLLTQ